MGSSELGIDLGSLRERELFRWFLACLLFGKPIQEDIARQAFLQLDQVGLHTPQAIVNTGWKQLVELLDGAHYVRYDFSTATKLLDVCNALMARYGTLKRIMEQCATPAQLAKKLQEFKGIGPVTAGIFIREIRPIWNAFKLGGTRQTGRQSINRRPAQKRHMTRTTAALPKGAKEAFHKGAQRKFIAVSSSQPHSKTFGR